MQLLETRPSATSECGEQEITAIRELLERRELGLAYQPIYNLATGKVFGFEALARPAAPFSRPQDLYRAAAALGQVGELGRLHRDTAVTDAPANPLFLNVHPNEFEFGYLVRPDDPLFRHKYTVYLEITESAPLSHFVQCQSVLTELRKKGIMLAIDDFGAGYSNLKYIADLSPDIVKIDRDLLGGIRDGTRQFKLLESIVKLCKSMGAAVVAEGIETVEELVVVERAGAEYCQGFLLGEPDLPARGETWPSFR